MPCTLNNIFKLFVRKASMANLFELSGVIGGIIIAGSYIPQIYKLLKTKTARGISTIFVTALLVGSLLLLIYSLYAGDALFIALNASASILAGTVLALSIYYKYHENEGSGKLIRKVLPKKAGKGKVEKSNARPKKPKRGSRASKRGSSKKSKKKKA